MPDWKYWEELKKKYPLEKKDSYKQALKKLTIEERRKNLNLYFEDVRVCRVCKKKFGCKKKNKSKVCPICDLVNSDKILHRQWRRE